MKFDEFIKNFKSYEELCHEMPFHVATMIRQGQWVRNDHMTRIELLTSNEHAFPKCKPDVPNVQAFIDYKVLQSNPMRVFHESMHFEVFPVLQ